MVKVATTISILKSIEQTSPLTYSPSKLLARIAQHLQLTRLLSVAIHPQASHDLVHGLARRLVLVEEIASEQDHVDIAFFRQAHDLMEGLPAVIATDGIAFVVADMVVGRDENTDRVRRCWVLTPKCWPSNARINLQVADGMIRNGAT